MTFTGKTEYGKVVAAKLRSQLVAEGLFAKKYHGNAAGYSVLVPVTDEATIADYNATSLDSNSVTYDGNAYITCDINKDRFVSLYLDGFDIASASYDEKKDALEKVAYAVANDMNAYAIQTLLYGAQGLDKTGTAYTDTFRASKTGTTVSVGSDDVYESLLDLAAAMTTNGVPMENRYLVVNGTGLAEILKSNKAIRQSDISQELIKKGFVSQIAGFNVKVSNAVSGTVNSNTVWAVAGHPDYCTDPMAFRAEPKIVDGDTDKNVVGGAFCKARVAYTYEVIDPRAFGILTA